MCGINGIVGPYHESCTVRQRLERMTDVLRHRGPDGSGYYLSPEDHEMRAALGHRRLSIVDLAGGHQPMCNETADIWITYNGEIYNHRQLRAELQALGHCFRTSSDTETIIHAYEEYGEACVEKLRGMFAFAIWDNRCKRLFAARDRLGIKPFYYAIDHNYFIFASEIKSILASQLVPAVMNDNVLPEFFVFGQTVDDATLFHNIHKLMPAHWLTWDGKCVNIQRYWDWEFDEVEPYHSDEYYLQRFKDILDETVRMHLMSDVPLGVFLSGGLDSSLIAAIMAQHVSEPIQTFSVGFEQKYYSELNFARTVANHLGSQHHEVIVKPPDFFESLTKLIWYEDEPLKGAQSIALYFVAKLAAEHVKVVLTGEGSDELFAGYNDRYWVTLVNQRLKYISKYLVPDYIRKHIIRRGLWDFPLPLKLKKIISHSILYYTASFNEILFDNFYGFFTPDAQFSLFQRNLHHRISGSDPYKNAVDLLHRSNAHKFLHQMLYTDVNMYLVELLMKQDQMSMAASIESRVPFLDHILVEFAGTVPPYLRLRGRQGKWIVKQLAAQLLPAQIVHRPKMGFPVPLDTWLKDGDASYIYEILLDERTRQRGYFNLDYVEKTLALHRQGKRDCQAQIWLLLNFELWNRLFIDGASTMGPEWR